MQIVDLKVTVPLHLGLNNNIIIAPPPRKNFPINDDAAS